MNLMPKVQDPPKTQEPTTPTFQESNKFSKILNVDLEIVEQLKTQEPKASLEFFWVRDTLKVVNQCGSDNLELKTPCQKRMCCQGDENVIKVLANWKVTFDEGQR